jgi:ssDNA-binding Zn-finger/Zn-ribbon topoisomerase 1
MNKSGMVDSAPGADKAPWPRCPAHGATMQLRQGRTGPFYGCARYPECRETAPVGLPGILCPKCQSPVVERIAKKSGRPFWPCGNRACDFVAWTQPHVCSHGTACFGLEPPPARAGALSGTAGEGGHGDDVAF